MFSRLEYVVEGNVLALTQDSIAISISKTWLNSDSSTHELTLFYSLEHELAPGQPTLLLADSSEKLIAYASIRDGCYIMQGHSSPKVLTQEDLRVFCSGGIPNFNTHESEITVHFPFSTEEISLHISQSGNTRIAESDFDNWNGREAWGAMCTGPGGTTLMGLHRSDHEDLYDPFRLAGSISSYANGVFSLDMWPYYPAFADIESYEAYCEFGYIPIYLFRLSIDSDEFDSVLPLDESYLLSDGRRFYLDWRAWNPWPLAYEHWFYPAFSRTVESQGSGSSEKLIVIRLEGFDTDHRKSLLMSLLEAALERPITASVYDQDPRFNDAFSVGTCSIELCSPEWEIETDSVENQFDDAILLFTATGRGIIVVNGTKLQQLYSTYNTASRAITGYNSALFEYPQNEELALFLQMSGIRNSPTRGPEYLIAGMLDSRYREMSLTGELYKVDLATGEQCLITSVELSRVDSD